jgi:hypothetical protein
MERGGGGGGGGSIVRILTNLAQMDPFINILSIV